MRLAIISIIYGSIVAVGIGLLWPLLRAGFDTPPQGERKRRNHPLKYTLLALFLIAFAFPEIGAVLPDGGANHFFQRYGNIVIGLALYFFGPLLFIQIGRLIWKLVKKKRGPWTRTWARKTFFALAFFSLWINLLGAYIAQDVKVTPYTLESDKIQEPVRIVLVGDLHIGVNSQPRLYREMVTDINAQDPDLVLVAGDIATSSYSAIREPDEYAELFREIDATYGTYVIYGNHDVDEPLLGGFTFDGEHAVRNPGLVKMLKDSGWTLLADETAEVPGTNITLAGRRDEMRPGDGVEERMPLDQLVKGIPEDRYLLLLQHEPDELDQLSAAGVDLSVSGHTHDGQIFPGNLYSRLACRISGSLSYGLKEWNGAWACVTSGVGYYGPPIRVCTISEIVVIDLVPAE